MSKLAAQIRAARDAWCDLGDGKRVKVRRPGEVAFLEMRHGLTPQLAVEQVVDWEGFTEADFLPPGVGSSDVVPFDREAWREYAGDSVIVSGAVFQHLAEAVTAALEAKKAAQGN